MKTPREIILEQHQVVAAQLDAVAARALAGEAGPVGAIARETPARGWLAALWEEMFWSCRGKWAGFTAVWVVLLAVNFSAGPKDATMGGRSAVAATNLFDRWREQQRLMADLMRHAPERQAKEALPQLPIPAGPKTAVGKDPGGDLRA